MTENILQIINSSVQGLPSFVLSPNSRISGYDRVNDTSLSGAYSGVFIFLVIFHHVMVPGFILYVCCCLWNQFVTMSRDNMCKLPLPPGGYGLPFVGETLHILIWGQSYFSKKRETYGDIYKTHLLGSPTIRIVGPENVKQILRGENTIVQAKWPASTHMLLGEGSLSQTTGYCHHIRKKAITKAFSFEAMSRYLPIIQDVTRKYIMDWCSMKRIMGHHALKIMNFDLACRLLLGFHGSDLECNELADVFEVFTANIFCIPIRIKGLGFDKALRAREKLLMKIDDIIESRDDDNDGHDVLSAVLNARGSENLSVNDVKNLCLELLFAGHETTTSATCSLVFHLAKNPEIVQRLHDELEAFGMLDNDLVDYQVLNQMNYLNNVVKEVLRISPPIGGGFRKALKTFEINGYQVPEGWTVTYAIRDTQETSVYFGNTDEFIPDRWEDVSPINSGFHYIPFGGGRRVCVGKDLAKLILKSFAFELVRGCKWSLESDKTSFTNFPVPTPVDGLPLKFESKH